MLLSAPSRLSHAWTDFKSTKGTSLTNLPSRFGSVSGNGRYQYWRVGVKAVSGHELDGWGPGTYQLVWLPHATPVGGYVVNAHSLYVETLSDLGIVGLALLIGFLALAVSAAIWAVVRSSDETRTRAAGAAAALLAFTVSAAFDWVWQLPVLPAAFMLIAAAVLAPVSMPISIRAISGETRAEPTSGGPRRWVVRGGLVLAAIACLVAISVPLATTSDVRKSQTAVAAGDNAVALKDANSAAKIEPGAASPQTPGGTRARAPARHPRRPGGGTQGDP